MIRVYHNVRFLDRPSWQWSCQAFPMPVDLYEVAEVATNNLEEAYHLTQNIDQPWIINDGVGAKAKDDGSYRHRSTSCGDIMMREDGSAYIVSSCGFQRVPYLDG